MSNSQLSESSTQVDNESIALIEEREHPTQKKSKRKSEKKTSDRFSNEEDKLLIQPWFNISKDPIVGLDQKGVRFLARISDNYKIIASSL